MTVVINHRDRPGTDEYVFYDLEPTANTGKLPQTFSDGFVVYTFVCRDRYCC